MEIAVVGSGGWGTAISMLLHRNRHEVTLISYSKEESDNLAATLENPFLPGVKLPADLHYTSDPAAVSKASLIVVVPPSFAVRTTVKGIAPYLRPDAVLVSATKGIEADTGMRMSEIVHEVTGKRVVVLSGPSHAEEVSREVPTGVVAACEDQLLAEIVQEVFMNDRFRVYTSSDPVGVELGAAMKNVIALCAGVCDGLGYGDNTKALLMTRGLTEVARLGMKLGSRTDTFAGLTGIGDLIVTCTSMHSRNRRAGILIGEGMTVQEAMKEVGAVVEGYYATQAVKLLADRLGVEMPITNAAYRVLYEGAPVGEALHSLMGRKKGKEIEDAGWS
ncbi:MAG: NAD(P)-dependent glycerol-3-phosphate dehydrogenase [Oscillospiraceae bacterium]|nr:NAD(P)-dependent glycerol-3-phosphate dehydrogenase [Oscillospiraceae bacterium]